MSQSVVPVAAEMDEQSRAELLRALARLDSGGGFMARAAETVGRLAGRGLGVARMLETAAGVRAATQGVVEGALQRAFEIAILRLGDERESRRSRRLAAPLVIASGAVGGFIGLAGFVPDVAVTTLAIMREIGRIAQASGEPLDDPETRAACLEVFALAPSGRSGEAGYYSARLVMQGRPLAMLLAEVAPRFGVSLSQKIALQAVPVVGALGGAAVNTLFLKLYRELAEAHFTIRRLERQFGKEAVRAVAEAR